MKSGVWCGPRMQELLLAIRSEARDGSYSLSMFQIHGGLNGVLLSQKGWETRRRDATVSEDGANQNRRLLTSSHNSEPSSTSGHKSTLGTRQSDSKRHTKCWRCKCTEAERRKSFRLKRFTTTSPNRPGSTPWIPLTECYHLHDGSIAFYIT